MSLNQDDLIANEAVADNPDQRLKDLERRVALLEQALIGSAETLSDAPATYVAIPESPADYSTTHSTDRTLVAASDTLPNVANVLGTLIADLQALGLLR